MKISDIDVGKMSEVLFPNEEKHFLNGATPTIELKQSIDNMQNKPPKLDSEKCAALFRKKIHEMYYEIWNCAKSMIGDKKVGFHDRLKSEYNWTIDELRSKKAGLQVKYREKVKAQHRAARLIWFWGLRIILALEPDVD